MDKHEKVEQAILEAKKRYHPLISIFSGELGKDAIELLEEEFIYTSSYTQGDSHHTAFLEGQRALVLWIKDVVNKHGDNHE